jgi:hypothetical protein
MISPSLTATDDERQRKRRPRDIENARDGLGYGHHPSVMKINMIRTTATGDQAEATTETGTITSQVGTMIQARL